MKYTSDIAFTPAVKAFQEANNSRKIYERVEQFGGWQSKVTPDLQQFLSTTNSFYFGTSNSLGQPYIQHRGGPKGFLKAIDDKCLAFADFSGNKQYISIGNLSENDKVFIFLMNYRNQTRIKIWGTAKVIHNDPELITSLSDESYRAKPERAILFKIEAWDVNCRQHITQLYTKEDIELVTQPLKNKIKELEEKLSER